MINGNDKPELNSLRPDAIILNNLTIVSHKVNITVNPFQWIVMDAVIIPVYQEQAAEGFG